MLVRMDLARIVIREQGDSQIIILREREGDRTFPILIGLNEAIAIDRRVKGIETSRPLTHDLMAKIIDQLDGKLEKVLVNDLKEHTFYATLVIRRNGDIISVDARPSDAIALGVANNTPLFVDDEVLRTVCATEMPESPEPDE